MNAAIPQSVYDQILNSRVTMLVGAVDTGKSTLAGLLAAYVVAQGRRCGIVDADTGQSAIGPPTTIGMGEFQAGMMSIGDVSCQAMYFVGAPSPIGHAMPAVIGTRRMVDAALRVGFEHVIIDTTGMIQGDFGESLKGYKIELLQPDFILFLEQTSECGCLIRRARSVSDSAVFVLRPRPQARTRSAEERRAFRAARLADYFSSTSELTVDCRQVWIADFPFLLACAARVWPEGDPACLSPVVWAERSGDDVYVICEEPAGEKGYEGSVVAVGCSGRTVAYPAEATRNALVGLFNEKHECFSLGVVRSIDFARQTMRIAVAENRAALAGVRFSRFSVDPEAPGMLSFWGGKIVEQGQA